MTEERHAPDTFFLVAEADWRLYREHCVADRDWMAEVDDFARNFLLAKGDKVDPLHKASPAAPVQPAYKEKDSDSDEELARAIAALPEEEPIGDAAASSSGGAGAPRPGRLGTPAPQQGAAEEKNEKPSFYGWTKASRHEAQEAYVTRDLRDLIQIANAAHRYNYQGDVVWYSWSGAGKAKNRPSYGSTLIGVSKEGAMKLMKCMELGDFKPMHFDIWLKQKLYDKEHDLQGCYVYPAVGGFDEHLSGCDPKGAGPGGVRESLWDQKNQVGGVRISPDNKHHKDRMVCAFLSKKGHADYGVKVEFGDDTDSSLTWKTLRPPSHYWEGDEMWQDILLRRGWLSRKGWLQLPSSLTAPAGHGDWRALEAQPDDRPWNRLTQRREPISRIAHHVVCTSLQDAERQVLTKRQKTEQRLNLTMYKKRCFVEDFWQAAQHDVLVYFKGYPDLVGRLVVEE